MEHTRTGDGEHRKSQDLLPPPPLRHGNLQLLSCLRFVKNVFLRPLSCWVGLLGMKTPQSSLLLVLLEVTLTNTRLGWEFLFPSVISNLSGAKRCLIQVKTRNLYQYNLYAIHQTLSYLVIPVWGRPTQKMLISPGLHFLFTQPLPNKALSNSGTPVCWTACRPCSKPQKFLAIPFCSQQN